MEKLLTTEEVAEYLRVDVVTIRRLVNRGELTAYRIAGEYRFTEPDIEDFVKRQRVSGGNMDGKEIFRHLNERARKAMALAIDEAQLLGHNYVGTEHLLLGLAGEGESIGARVLSAMNFSVEQARTEILEILRKGQQRSPLVSKLKSAIAQTEIVLYGRQSVLTQRTKKVVEMALKEARKLGQNAIGTEHLLLGLIDEGEGLGIAVLENLNIKLQEVRAKTLEMIKASETATETPSVQLSKIEEENV